MSSNNEWRKDFLLKIIRYAKEARDAGYIVAPGAVAAQAALESAFGTSKLSTDGNNLFGIKATKSWDGPVVEYETKECINGEWITITARFRKYESWRECVFDYAKIINRLPWYRDAVDAARVGDDIGFINGLLASEKQPGWATDPKYAEKIKRIMDKYNVQTLVKAV
ncbi:MAG: glucosaminidase domain-containing protein [Candidatus Methanomethylicaceae archaeon]